MRTNKGGQDGLTQQPYLLYFCVIFVHYYKGQM